MAVLFLLCVSIHVSKSAHRLNQVHLAPFISNAKFDVNLVKLRLENKQRDIHVQTKRTQGTMCKNYQIVAVNFLQNRIKQNRKNKNKHKATNSQGQYINSMYA
ncbi:unnamed protein product [Sphenostylis stenocarpa]|uniref:Secreted protein n=1 Tax=Sphenostylis stenocarpa TaxID=92480 RepID=A0AA86S1I3_9FABA|nr:unnamed protein product [Sphenostylis stenocarpa]